MMGNIRKRKRVNVDTNLKGHVVFITGASGGIGQACAKAFADEAATLVLHGRSNLAALEALRQNLSVDSLIVSGDVSQETDVDAMFRQAFDAFGRIDTVVVNAAMWPPEDCPVDDMPLERWQRVVDVNQTSVFLCVRGFFRILKQTRPESASLILIGSSAGVFGEAFHVEYAASKAAMMYGMTRSLKNEIVKIVPRGRVNAVCPGWTRTPMAEPGLQDQAAYRRAMQTRAIPQISEPEDIAPLVVFLASDRLAGHITGEIITVAGGMEGRILWDEKDI